MSFHEKSCSVNVSALSTTGSYFTGTYDSCIMCGELQRNICVNLNIDPDQDEGFIKNVNFYQVKTAEELKICKDQIDATPDRAGPYPSTLGRAWNHPPHAEVGRVIGTAAHLYLLCVCKS